MSKNHQLWDEVKLVKFCGTFSLPDLIIKKEKIILEERIMYNLKKKVGNEYINHL